jgi:glycosyltransferase involved in cell wall biosynthesis
VRNPFIHDARVLRAAHVLRERGLEPLVVAVMSTEVRRAREEQQGIAVLRLDPTSPVAALRSRLRRRAASGMPDVPAPGHVARPRRRAGRAAVRLHRWMRTIDFYRRAWSAVRVHRPALLQCNDYNTMWVGVLARLLRRGTAVVYDSHELWPDRNQRPEPRWWLLACEALFVRAAHVVVAASPGYADVMARRYRTRRPLVVRNIPAAPPPRAAEPATEPGVAVYAGALTAHRGLEQAIDALALVPELRLRLHGPGRPEYVDGLFARARAAGVDGRLERRETVAPGDVVAALRGAALGLALFQPMCLSHRLVAPNKVFEYLAAGLPSLASDLPVMTAFVNGHGVGRTVDAQDVEAIAAAARALLDPEENLARRRAVVAAAREVTWEREREVLDAAYARALAAAV